MRRLLVWLPILLTACNGNLMGPEGTLGGPLGRFGHSLTLDPATPAPVASRAPEIASLPTPAPTSRQPASSPVPASPTPRPSPKPTPTPTPKPELPVILLTPDPVPTALAPAPGLTDVTVSGRYLSFTVWDNGDEDGDRIRLYLNGKVVEAAWDLSLLNAGTRLALNLQPGRNELRFTALNEGLFPPNTFALRLDADLVVSGSATQLSRFLQTGESDVLTVYAP